MGATIGFILFLIYTTLIFFIKSYFLLGIVLIINLFLMIIFRISFKNTLLFIFKLMPFILFTAVFNMLFEEILYGVLIGLRLVLVCNITYIFSIKMTPKKLQVSVQNILFPLKIFKVNTRDIGIIVSISIAFIPILQKEIQNLKYSLISKGFRPSFRNIIKSPNLILAPLLASIIKKTGEIEQSMISKGYVGE